VSGVPPGVRAHPCPAYGYRQGGSLCSHFHCDQERRVRTDTALRGIPLRKARSSTNRGPPRRRRPRRSCGRQTLPCSRSPAAGRRNENTVPPPLFGSAQSRPPCASMIVRQIERPMPSPLTLVVTKGSNNRLRTFSGRPCPVSATDTATN